MTGNLALFDFDGTITEKDSLPDFIQYAVGRSAYWAGLLKLSPMLAAYTFGMIPNHVAKERLIANFFTGWDAEQFQKTANQYSLHQLDRIVRAEAVERMRRHQAQGDRVKVTHGQFLREIQGLSRAGGLEHAAEQTVYLTPPFAHSYGLSSLLEYTSVGTAFS